MSEPEPPAERSGHPGHARLSCLLDALSALETAVLILKADHRLVATNRAFITLAGLGVRQEQLAGAHLPSGPATFSQAYAEPAATSARLRSIAGQGRHVTAERHALASGTVAAHTYAPITAGGDTVGHLWIIKAVPPADHRIEETSAAAGTETATPAATGAATARPGRAGGARTALASALAHEVRTPATSIAAFASMLDDTDLDAGGRRRAADAVRRNAERILLLAADLVLISDLETGTWQRGDQVVDLAGILRNVTGRLAERHDVAVSDGPAITGDARLVRRAVATVISTVAAATDQGTLSIRADADPTGWSVTVAGPVNQPMTTELLLALRVPDPGDPETSRTAALAMLLVGAIAGSHGGWVDTTSHAGEYRITMRLAVS
ncbi:MAG: HAMP domain-containing histidine kinase [Dactylosporangium sp.]|nr:hypothetical protein [Dactylosporangium sp.]NNJ62366.1 HAMP domain-containing histidine kinase [Dactylosporangium sp.]